MNIKSRDLTSTLAPNHLMNIKLRRRDSTSNHLMDIQSCFNDSVCTNIGEKQSFSANNDIMTLQVCCHKLCFSCMFSWYYSYHIVIWAYLHITNTVQNPSQCFNVSKRQLSEIYIWTKCKQKTGNYLTFVSEPTVSFHVTTNW